MTVSVEEQAKALAASEMLASGLAELLRFAREGELSAAFAFTDDTIGMLADATRLAIQIEAPRLVNPNRDWFVDSEGAELLNQLAAACSRFAEDWKR